MRISIPLRIATVIGALLPASAAHSLLAECIFTETCVDNSCLAIDPAVLRFNAMRVTDEGVSFFIVADPVLMDGPTIDDKTQFKLIGIVVDGGVGQLSLLPNEKQGLQFSLSSFRLPVLSQMLLIQETGPDDPSPATITVEEGGEQGIVNTVHSGICEFVE